VSQKKSVRTALSAPAPLKRERRASVRCDCNAKGTCQTLAQRQESPWKAMVLNISCQGIGVLLGRRFEPGTLLTIELTESSAQRQRLLLARVAHATPQPEDKWLIGCTLINPLDEEELHELL
jgi:hypothetical protein